jgi:uncharacterized damage-inducible protein DinB
MKTNNKIQKAIEEVEAEAPKRLTEDELSYLNELLEQEKAAQYSKQSFMFHLQRKHKIEGPFSVTPGGVIVPMGMPATQE